MTDYAPQYQQGHHGHGPAHLQNYPSASQNTAGSASITSPTQQGQMHQPYNQTSPILPSQGHSYPSGGPQNAQGHQVHPQMGYPQYNVPGGMHGNYMSPSQAQQMAAQAAAGPTFYPMQDQSIPGQLSQDTRASPRVGVQKDPRGAPRSPTATTGSMVQPGLQSQVIPQGQARRQSQQLSSPAVQQPPQVMTHMPPRATGPPHMPQAPQAPPPAEMPPGGGAEESPLYVNAKQFHRILKRRNARQKLEDQLRLTPKGRKPYLHESRHNHAMRRPRGPGGRFLTADEVAAMEAKGELPGMDGDLQDKENTPAKGMQSHSSGSAKRKAESSKSAPSKKSKRSSTSGEDDEDDEDEADEE